MPQKTVAKFEIANLQILDENGNYDSGLMPKLSNDEIVKMYEWMVLTRMLDEKMIKMQRTGRLGTIAPCKGQEATQIGCAMAMRKTDWLVPMYRDTGLYLARGLSIENYLQYWSGDERGLKIPENENDLPLAIPVGSQFIHATGLAYALKYRKAKAAVLALTGDGGTSTPEFQDGLNFAGVLQVPVVFVIENNQWAISVPRERQSKAETLAQKGIAYGIECLQVDGNDVFAVYKAVKEALERARDENKPMLIECVTYRLEMHTTADDPLKYRKIEEVQAWEKKDPIARLKKFMMGQKIWSEEKDQALTEKTARQIEDSVARFEKLDQPEYNAFLKYVYAQPTQQLIDQQRLLDEWLQAEKEESI